MQGSRLALALIVGFLMFYIGWRGSLPNRDKLSQPPAGLENPARRN